jgi:ankyrin repeat protein
MTPLALAAFNGHRNAVGFLMEQGAFVSLPCGLNNKNALHFAAMHGHNEVVKLLLENTEDATAIEAIDSSFATPLTLAIANGHVETVSCSL